MSDAKRFDVINPATGETVKSYDGHTDEEAAAFVSAAAEAQRRWRRTSFSERAAVLKRAAEVLRERAGAYAELMAVEMGACQGDVRAMQAQLASRTDLTPAQRKALAAARSQTLEYCTPGLCTWQDLIWPSHCGDC